MSLEDIREEYKAQRIGPLVVSELRQSVRRVVRRYQPLIYAGSYTDSWTEDALEDLVQDVALNRLWRGGQLDYAMAHASDLAHFRSLLDRQVRHELASRRNRTLVDNLLDRCKSLLAEPPFRILRSGFYSMESQNVSDPLAREAELRIAAALVRQLPRIPNSDGERASPVYSTETLKTALILIAQTIPAGFSTGDLDKIFSMVLTSSVPSLLIDLQEEVWPSEELGPELVALVQDTVEKTRADLGTDRLLHFRLLVAGCSFDEVARTLGMSRPTEIKRRTEIMRILETNLAEMSQQVQSAVLSELYAKAVIEEIV